jgi:hypothetical protein
MRMLQAHGGEDRVSPRMLARTEQRFDNRQTLGSNRKPAAAASLGKFGQPLGRVGSAPSFIYEL